MAEQVLITGGAGFLGSVMTPHLLSLGYKVRVLDNFRHRQPSLLAHCINPDLEIVRGDARDEGILANAMRGVDWIIPLAAVVGAPACDRDKCTAKTLNYDAVMSILKLRGKEQRVLYPNTNSGYGIGDKGKECTEESPLRPISLYGQTKTDAENAVLDAGNSLTFRLATVFGLSPRMRLDLLVNDFTYRAVHDRAVVLFEPHFKRNYIHIRDVARAFELSIRNFKTMQGKSYNVGLSDANLSKMELCGEIKKQIPGFVFLEAPIGEDPDKRDYIVSNARIEAAGFKPKYGLQDGIQELIKGFKAMPASEFTNL